MKPTVGAKPAVDEGCGKLAVPQLKERLPYGPGEALSYEVALNGAKAAQIDITLQDRVTEGGKVAYPAVVSAESSAVVSFWSRMKAELTTLIDPSRGLPLLMRSNTQADGRHYQEDVRFDGHTRQVEARTALNGKPWNGLFKSDADLVDALSILYYARSRDVQVGQPYCFDMYQGRVLWRIRGRVTGVEEVDTAAGPMKAFATSGVASIVGRTGAANQARQYTAYMSADEDRIPVLLKTPTPIGEVVAKLVRFEQGRRLTRAH
ncbi:MAG: DUF3108 domain-containing protein [Myxococcota bacterium]